VAFAEDGEVAVVREWGVVRASNAVCVAVGRGDAEDDAPAFGLEAGDGGGAPVGAAAQDETRAHGQRAERRRGR
jgi:hypothetical protein